MQTETDTKSIINLKKYALSVGWELKYEDMDRIYKRFDNPHTEISYTKDNLTLWISSYSRESINLGVIYGVCEVIDGYYTNQRYFTATKSFSQNDLLKILLENVKFGELTTFENSIVTDGKFGPLTIMCKNVKEVETIWEQISEKKQFTFTKNNVKSKSNPKFLPHPAFKFPFKQLAG